MLDNDPQPPAQPARRRSDEVAAESSRVDPGDNLPIPARQQIARFIAEAFSSPYPPPDVMRAYNEACPGSADKLIAMTEEVGRHKRALELIQVNAEVENMRRDYREGRVGQVCAVLVAFAAIGGAAYTATHGAQWAGSILGAGGLGTIVATFIYGRKTPRKAEMEHLDPSERTQGG